MLLMEAIRKLAEKGVPMACWPLIYWMALWRWWLTELRLIKHEPMQSAHS